MSSQVVHPAPYPQAPSSGTTVFRKWSGNRVCSRALAGSSGLSLHQNLAASLPDITIMSEPELDPQPGHRGH